MPNLRGKTWTTSTPANVEDAQFWEDHLISNEDASKLENITGVPNGGSLGQVLTKTTGGIEWRDPASSGHTIQNADGADMPYQGTLQFLGADVANDSENGKTVVDCHGQKGDAATIAAGTVTMLPAGSTPTVTNTGTSSAAVFDFGIPSSDGGVSSFNGRSGSILPMAGDYDSEKILLASVLHIGGETQSDVQEALEALADNGGGGHTILNSAGEAMSQRKKLKFVNATVSDDEEDDSTNVTVEENGHVIKDSSGTSMPQRINLQFNGAAVTDDSTNGKTIVTTTPQSMISDAWVSGHTYAVGDYCIDGNVLYKCKTAHTSSASYRPPYASYWEAVTVASELNGLISTNLNEYTPPDIVSNRFTNVIGGYLRHGQRIDVYIIADATSTFSGKGDSFYGLPVPINKTFIPLDALFLEKLADGRYGKRIQVNECITYSNADDTKCWISLDADTSAVTPADNTYRVIIIGTYYCI